MDESRLPQLLEQQRQLLHAAEARKGQRATNKASRQQLLMQAAQHDVSGSSCLTISSCFLMRISQAMPTQMYNIYTCQLNHAYPPSSTPVSELKPISISELRLETRHVGRALIVRTFSRPKLMSSVMSLIEDSKLDVDQIAVYNEDPKANFEHILPKDTVFAVKEPYYKKAANGGYLVRVDHPSDLVKLAPTHPMVPKELAPSLRELNIGALGLKEIGNAAFKKKDYLPALEAYSRALDVCGEDAESIKYDLYRNRAIVNTHLQRYEQASSDAMSALIPKANGGQKEDKDNVKALYRAGHALYCCEQFSEAESAFQQLLSISSTDPNGMAQLAKTKARLEEAIAGKYNFAAMGKSVDLGHQRLDHATFTANVVVRPSGKKGRGLFATKEIKSGELILVEKAFAVAFESEIGTKTYIILNLNTNTGRIGPHAILFLTLVQKMLRNPSQARQVLQLFDGGYAPKCIAPIVDGVAVIDTFQVAAMMEHNAFGCPNTRSTDGMRMKESGKQSISVGIWPAASYMNHACDPNSRRAFFGDMMIIRATKDIAKDQEISIAYCNAQYDNVETQKNFLKTWKFRCDCRICTAESQTSSSDRKERQGLVKEFTTFCESYSQTARHLSDKAEIAKAEELYAKLDATYDKIAFTNVPRLPLAHLGVWLCDLYSLDKAIHKVLPMAQATLKNLGYEVTVQHASKPLHIDCSNCSSDGAEIDAAMYAAHSSFDLGNVELGKQYEAFAKARYYTYNGEMRGFEEKFGKVNDSPIAAN